VFIVTRAVGWMIQHSNPSRDKTFFLSPKCPDWLRDPHSLLFKGYWGFSQAVTWLGHEVDHHLHLMLRLRVNVAVLPL
jgi:hypothetical protein